MIKYKKTLKFTIIFILLSIVSTVSYFIYSFEKNSHITSETSTILESGNLNDTDEEMPDLRTVEGITNILLIGSDARSLNEKSRSDAIMILTIDSIHKKLKVTSILRDTYVKIPGYGEEKINHSFNYGGPELLLKSIENNLSIKLDKYVIVNFFGFKDLINSIGGLDIDIKPEEVKESNKIMLELNEDPSNLIKNSGLQHFNGQQVLAYSRIRHVGNGCYDRTHRQRHVVSLIINKLTDTPVIKYPVVASKLLPYVKTNIDISEILNYAYTVYQIKNFTPEQLQIPLTELSYAQLLSIKGWVLLMDKYQNAKILNDFIFDDKTYSKSDLDYASCKKAIDSYLSKIEKPKAAKSYIITEPVHNTIDSNSSSNNKNNNTTNTSSYNKNKHTDINNTSNNNIPTDNNSSYSNAKESDIKNTSNENINKDTSNQEKSSENTLKNSKDSDTYPKDKTENKETPIDSSSKTKTENTETTTDNSLKIEDKTKETNTDNSSEHNENNKDADNKNKPSSIAPSNTEDATNKDS
ncbi:LCP family protein [Clostridium sp. ZS2-4]|uniref:LCP family protein n=1 Tax=Clostridium sp. ZS2-4 TaxID=2987703 RepID=UPI00227C67F4|nr:LCP family protein [Clostridium sp. ZS2-4]MCY6354624.1 LCP family protein [Clostridium sp. ZS2-4]